MSFLSWFQRRTKFFILDQYIWPNDLESARCNPSEIKRFTKEIRELGVLYTGLCCGNCPAMFRELAEVYGRTP
jgi:hypothetical protein